MARVRRYPEETPIAALERRLAILERSQRLFPMVRSRVVDNTGGTISTTEAIEKTVTVTIPDDWNTYDVDVFCSVRVSETGTMTAARNLDLRLRKDTVSGTIWGRTIDAIGTAAPDNTAVMTFNGYAEGETAIGVRSIHFTAFAAGDSGQMSWDELRLVAYAWRIS